MRTQKTEKLTDTVASLFLSKRYGVNIWLPRWIKVLWLRRKNKELYQNLELLEYGEIKEPNLVKWKRIVVALLWVFSLPLIALLIYLIYKIPQLMVAEQSLNLTNNEWLQRTNEARATLVQGIVGLILLFGLFFTWRNIRATEKNLMISQDATAKNLEIAQEGLVTQRFSKAIELLGSDKTDVRLGGIYALERIAKESKKDHWPIMEILTAFVRENAPWKKGDPAKPIRTDIQAVLTVLGRREREHEQIGIYRSFYESRRLDLHETNLHGADLFGANFAGIILTKANLTNSRMLNTNLECSILDNADLSESDITDSNFEDSTLSGTLFKTANLYAVKFDTNVQVEPSAKEPTDFEGADFKVCSLRKRKFINGNFRDAKFQGGSLDGANLKGASFIGATFDLINLKGVDLREVEGLVQEQFIKEGIEYEKANLPKDIQKLLSLKEHAKIRH